MEEKFKLIQLIIAVTTVQIWKTRTKVSIKQSFINSNTVFKQMCTELKRRKITQLSLGHFVILMSKTKLLLH